MIEKFPKLEKTIYTNQDLEKAEQIFQEAERKLNSFDLNEDNIDMNEALKAKKNWEEARKKYSEIFNSLNPELKE